VLAFQPHRYTRTRDCFEDFVRVLAAGRCGAADRGLQRRRGADRQADGKALARALRLAGREPLFVPEVADMPAALQQLTRGGDVVIGMGAGSMSSLPGRVQQYFGGRA
jgi:UDP-N-acetylmuramate--alanine ligase